jgi:hypothetical protein
MLDLEASTYSQVYFDLTGLLLPYALVLNQAPPQKHGKNSKQHPLDCIEKCQPVHLGPNLLGRKLNPVKPEPGVRINS